MWCYNFAMLPAEGKKVLRKSLLDKRLSLPPKKVQEFSGKILNTLSDVLDFKSLDKIYVYSPIYNEVDTAGFIDDIKHKYPGIDIEIAPNKASTSSQIPSGETYDLVIVPVLGFDRRGFRLGYGGGYYDKFLAKNECKQVVGLAYSFSEIKKVPDEPHDQKLQIIITEKETIQP